MLCNYHTHTKRCHHAVGEDREYVENAIKTGIKVLGFSDHPPYIFDDGCNSCYRIDFNMIDDYCNSVLSLKKEYARDIDIKLGFELEYYRGLHEREMKFLRQFNPEYIILGQHYVGGEDTGVHTHAFSNEQLLTLYVDECIEGLQTGDFTFLAHPDLAGFRCPSSVCEREYTRLLAFAKDNDFPIELNGYGLNMQRHYPDRRLFVLAEKIGNKVIIGIDAHDPNNISPQTYQKAYALIKGLNLNLIDKLDI